MIILKVSQEVLDFFKGEGWDVPRTTDQFLYENPPTPYIRIFNSGRKDWNRDWNRGRHNTYSKLPSFRYNLLDPNLF